MHGTITSPKPEKPVELKTRTITLTDRAPIRIVEDEWPELSVGTAGRDLFGGYGGVSASIRVRRFNKPNDFNTGKRIVHGHFTYDDPRDDEEGSIHVRVGKLMQSSETTGDLWKRIAEVGEELKQRIPESMRNYVTLAVDRCFADLPALEY